MFGSEVGSRGMPGLLLRIMLLHMGFHVHTSLPSRGEGDRVSAWG